MPNWKKVIVSGSDAALNTLTVSNGITGSLQGTASYASNADSLDGKDSSIFATTGSNIFIGNQTVTGSLFTSGSNTLIGTTTLTGSLNITGSTTQVGNNNLLGNTTLSGSIIMSGALGTNNPTVRIYGDTTHNGYIRFDPVTTNIDPNISASYIYVSGSTKDLYFTQNGNGYNNTTRLRWLEGNLYSGLLNGGLLSTQSSTVYQVSSGSGIIVDLNASYTDNPYPIITYISWPNLSASIAPLSASYDQTFVAIESNGTIGVSSTPYTNGQIDTQIVIGVVTHNNRSTIDGVKTQPKVAYGWKQRSNIFIEAFGPLKLSGLVLSVSGSSTGSLVVSNGTAFQDGANYTVDANDPAYISDTGTNISKIYKYRQSGSNWVYDTNAGTGYGAIDPTNYSNNGVLTPVPTNNWSIQRVYYFPSSPIKAIVVYYGNAVYTTELDAIANINIEAFTEAPNTAANAVYLGALILRYNANFNTAASYKIIPGGLFRAVGGSGGGGGTVTQTLAGLSDVAISGPTDGQPLVYDSTLLKWKNASTLTASLSGTASYASNANSSSYALSASYALNTTSASYALNSTSASYALNATSASNALTASYLNTLNQDLTFNGNLTLNGTASINYLNVIYETASVIYSSGSNQFGDAADDTQTLYGSVIVPTGSLTVSGSLTVFTGSGIELQVTNTGVKIGNAMSDSHTITGSLRISGSATAVSTSVFTIVPLTTLTASFTLNVNGTTIGRGTENHIIRGNSLAITGSLRVTGSNHTVIGNTTTTGNIIVTGSADITGSLNVTSGITGSLLGTASWASNAVTASYVLNAVSSSFATTASYVLNAVSSSFATTASYVLNAVSSSFASTASFVNPLNQNVTITGSTFISSSNATQLRVGSDLLFVSSSGNVGIGDTNPTRKLVVNRGSVGDVALFYGGVQGMFIYSSNNSVSFGDGANTAGNAISFASSTGDGVTISTNSFGPRLSISSTSFYVLPPSSFASNVTITGSASNSLRVKGSGATSASNALYVENSANTNILTLKNNGSMIVWPDNGDEFAVRPPAFVSDNTVGFIFKPGQNYGYNDIFLFGGSRYGIFAQNNSSVNALSWATGYNYQITSDLVGIYGNIPFWQMNFFSQYAMAPTSGDTSQLNSNISFAPSAGSASFAVFSFRPTINQTGTATGISRGLYIAPTLTSASSFRAIEWNNNSNSFGLYGSGSAANVLRGNTTIGTLTTGSATFNVSGSSDFKGNVTITGSASNSLRVKGSGTTSATNALYVEDSSNTQTFTVRNDGVIIIGETRTNLSLDPVNSRIIFASPSSNGLIGYSSYNTFLAPTELRLFSGTGIAGYTNALGDFRFYNVSTAKTYMYISDTGRIGINKGTVTPNAELDVSGSVIITGSLTVITGSNVEFQVLNTGVKIGNVVGDIHTVTGSLRVSGSITGSLQGTASAAQTIISRYVCQGKLNADQSIASNNDVVIQFVDDFDPNNWYNAGTYQFLPTIGGYYSISAGVWFDNTTDTNNQMNIQARKNGNSFALVQSPTNGVTGQGLTFTKMVYLNGSTDYVDFSAYQSTGNNVNIQQGTADGSGTWFSAFLIST